MKEEDEIGKPAENSQLKSDQKKPQNQWWIAIKGVKDEIRNGWLPDITMAVVGGTIGGVIGNIMNTRRGMLIGVGVGVTFAIWVIIWMMIRHIPPNSENTTAEKAVPSITPTISAPSPLARDSAHEKGATPSQHAQSQVEQNRPPASSGTGGNTEKPVIMTKEQQTKPPSIDNSIKDSPITGSPGAIQAPGGNVTINHGPQPRTLTEKQYAEFVLALKRSAPIEKIKLGCTVTSQEAYDLAYQLFQAFKEARWPIIDDRVNFMTTERPQRGVVLYKRGKPLPDSPLWEVITTPTLAVLHSAFAKIGINAQITAHRNLPEDQIDVFVGAQ